MDIINPMENEPIIFNETNPELLKKLNKPIITARVIIFILSGLCFSIAFIDILKLHNASDDGIKVAITFGGMGAFYLLFGLFSYKKPFISILVPAIFNTFCCLSWLFVVFYNQHALMQNTIGIFVQLTIVFLLIRGTVFARKLKKLTLTVG